MKFKTAVLCLKLITILFLYGHLFLIICWVCIFIYTNLKQMDHNINYDNVYNNNIKNNQYDSNHQLFRL